MTELNPEVIALAEAVQAFVNATHDETHLVTQALVVYEAVTVDGDRHVAYSVPTENWALTGALGLADAARHLIRRDSLDGAED